MTHQNIASFGATGPHRDQTGRAVPTGWRKATPALAQAERLADAGTNARVEKGRAVVAVKRVAAYIGLKPADLLLLDTLAAFSKAQDWEAGRRPIVWPSNAYLMEQTGFSLSTLKRHAKRLAELGLLAFRDSPNGKRWGHRDAQGVIIEAYGFDLAPLGARMVEFEAVAAERAAERALCQRLKRQITAQRRMIRAQLDAVEGRYTSLNARFDWLLGQLPAARGASDVLTSLLGQLHALRDEIEPVISVDQDDNGASQSDITEQKMTPREVKNDPHIPTTIKLHSVESSCKESLNAEAMAPQKEDVRIDLGTVLQACPEFAYWARNMVGFVKNWRDFHRIAGDLKGSIGISDHAWGRAQQVMGPQMAAVALALVFEKHALGEVASAGGYLRGITEKAGAGQLHLACSIYGRLNRVAA